MASNRLPNSEFSAHEQNVNKKKNMNTQKQTNKTYTIFEQMFIECGRYDRYSPSCAMSLYT